MKNSPVNSISLIWTGCIIAGIFVSAISGAPFPSLLETLVLRPLFSIVALLIMALVASRIQKRSLDQIWSELLSLVPYAFGGAILVSLLGIWNDGSGTLALPVTQAGEFIISFGLLPRLLGPEILLRAFVLFMAISYGVQMYRREHRALSAFFTSVVLWLVGAIILLVTSPMAWIVGVWNEATIDTALDASRALGIANTNAYWSNFQAERFFTGVTRQLETSIDLSTAAVLVVLACVALTIILTKVSPWLRPGVLRAVAKRLFGFPCLWIFSALATTLILGWPMYRVTWNTPNILALGCLIVMLFAWYIFWFLGQEDEQDECKHERQILMALSLAGGLVLGWPMLLLTFSLFGLSWLAAEKNYGWLKEWRGRAGVWAALSTLMVAIGACFVARSVSPFAALYMWMIGWGILGVAKELIRAPLFHWPQSVSVFVVMILAGIAFAFAVHVPVAIALMALILLVVYWKYKTDPKWIRYAEWGLLLFGWGSVMLMKL